MWYNEASAKAMEEDLYKVLGIRPDADLKQVRSAHRHLARKYHPDAGATASDEKFRAVQQAYDVLSDPQKRASYDRSRQARQQRPEWPSSPFRSGRWATGAHTDLRFLSRQVRPETVDLRRVGRPAARQADPWDILLEFFFRDLF